ncbi:FHA domain-containing protein [Variovorax sp. PAMC28562]|uniref:FHA domain-containing protein n=1 Tax=Variovorax sp. PAMC28562 TaxID=2762323 RepID=UPI00164D1914|nr:FHA domain-containing protein [Variovorax sp. PAMC28562]QNK73860.1 FHA domain-containing protein [Variovorax sp. PAMC28562]
MPKLILTRAGGDLESFELTATETTLGRSLHSDIVLHDIAASRRHAVITVDAAFVTIRDANSRNGTLVNGQRVMTQTLADGDVVGLGGCALRFVSGDQQYSEVVAQGVSSVPNWIVDDLEEHVPTAPDVPLQLRRK